MIANVQEDLYLIITHMHGRKITDSEVKFAEDIHDKLGSTVGETIHSLKTCGHEKTLLQMEATAKARTIDISAALNDFRASNSN